jgi:hypothetical protein
MQVSLESDRTERETVREPRRTYGDDPGPAKPKIERPSAPNELMRRLKKVDPDQAKRYRQRSGQ